MIPTWLKAASKAVNTTVAPAPTICRRDALQCTLHVFSSSFTFKHLPLIWLSKQFKSFAHFTMHEMPAHSESCFCKAFLTAPSTTELTSLSFLHSSGLFP